MNSITKPKMINYLEITCGLNKTDAERAVDSLLDLMSKSLLKGDRIMLNGIGVLAGKTVPPRLVAGFKEDYHIGERIKVTFRPSKGFKDSLREKTTIKSLKQLGEIMRQKKK